MAKLIIEENKYLKEDIEDYLSEVAEDLNLDYQLEEEVNKEENIVKEGELVFHPKEKTKEPHNITFSSTYKDRDEITKEMENNLENGIREISIGEDQEEATYDRFLITSSNEELEDRFAKKLFNYLDEERK